MRRISYVLSPLFFLLFLACTKIDTTTLGNDLIPVVDNINTFDTSFDVETDLFLLNDSTRAFLSDDLPVGELNDPEFGRTTAELYFNISPSGIPFTTDRTGTNPFTSKDSVVKIDSVVLSLGYMGTYGDTNTIQTFRVFEINPASGFKDSSYLIRNPPFSTLGELGSKSVDFTKLNDSSVLIRKRDTSKVVNVLRIPILSSLGTRFSQYDTTNTANGGYRNDSIFKTLFRGLAIKTDASPANKALSYFNLSDPATSKLIVYFQVKRNGAIDTISAEYYHTSFGQASLVNRTPANGYLANLTSAATNEQQLYLQSTPGSYASIRIPNLELMNNRVIHLAELIVPKITSIQEDIFTHPNLIFLDMLSPNKDTSYTIQNDFEFSTNFGINFDQFGGRLQDNANFKGYRFNISRHVQGIVTRKEPNYMLRLHAPFEATSVYLPPGKLSDLGDYSKIARSNIPVGTQIARGRVVVGGGANTNPSSRMKLRIIYSKI